MHIGKTNEMRVLLCVGYFIMGICVFASPHPADFGAHGVSTAMKDGKSLSVVDMLRYAVEDEYLARAEYRAIMEKFGNITPFTNIEKSENQHLEWLRTAYGNLKLPFPDDDASAYVVIPQDLKAAAQAGIDAEINNINMYKTFLNSSLLADPGNSDLVILFGNLKRASENHLKAFQNLRQRY